MNSFMRDRSKIFYVAMCGFLLTGLSFGLQRAAAEDFAPVVREASFASGGVVILDANVGDVHVRPTDHEGKLRLVITAHKQEDATAAPHWVREFAVNGSQAKIELEMPKHGEHNFDVTLYVPKRSDLRLNLAKRAGNRPDTSPTRLLEVPEQDQARVAFLQAAARVHEVLLVICPVRPFRNQVGKLRIVNFPNERLLQKEGGNL